jgi:hypothetical protein
MTLALLGLALCSPAPALGQAARPSSSEPESSQDVVVTGEKLGPEEARRRAEDFVKRVGVVWGNKQAARWWDPVCPRVVGLAPPLAQQVEKRVRAVAVAAGAPIAPASARCEANLVIGFTGDAGADVRKIAARAPRQLRNVPPETRSDLLNGKAPIRWFYHSELRNREGMRGLGFMPDWSAGNGEGTGSVLPDNGNSVSLMQWSSGHISTSGIRALTGATVLVDVNLAEGATLDAVASYAALVGLAEVRLSEERPPSSILRLFDSADAPLSLTELDLSFLKSLYRIPLDRNGRAHRGAIVRDLIASQP